MIGKQNFLWQTLRDDKKNLFLIGLLITNMLLAGLFNSLIYTRFGECIELSMADKMGLVKDTAITILVIIFFDFIRNTLYGLTVSYTSENVFLSIKKRIFKKLTDLPVAFLEQKQDKADIINRINTDLGKLKDALTNDLTWRLRLVIVGAIAGVNCFLINWKLAIGYFFILLPSVFFLKKISVRIIAAQKERSKNIGSIISVLMDYMNGILICRSFNLEKILSSRFDEFNEKTGAASFDSEKIGLRLSTIQLVTNAAMVILLFIFGIVFIINGYLSVGGLIAFVTISYSVQNALGLLDSLFSTFRNMKASSTRIQEFLDLESERRGRCFEINNNAPVIELDDFRFSFTNKEILRGLRLIVNRGEHIGIAGLSGCGKSTLLKLLAGFYETNEGCLLFGYPQHEWDPRALCENMSFVSQETYLFNDTLRENIRLGRLDANEDEIQDAVNRANLTEFINSLPEGLNTQAGKGGKLLSGGQRQRIAIARALLKNAPLILMDEPASALDRESLIDIKETIRGLPEKYTVLVVSHSFMLFDENTQIYYMDNGEFTENGTMNELVAQKGKFSVQWKSQVENEEQIQN